MNEPWCHRKETVFTVASHSNCLTSLLNTKLGKVIWSIKGFAYQNGDSVYVVNTKFHVYVTGLSKIDDFG